MRLAFGLPVLLLGGLELPAFLGVANELGVVQLLDRRLHLSEGGLADFIDQEGGDIGLGAGQVADELQQADRLRDPQCPALVLGVVLEPLADLVDVGALLGGQVAFDQFEHLVQRDQRADRLWTKSVRSDTSIS